MGVLFWDGLKIVVTIWAQGLGFGKPASLWAALNVRARIIVGSQLP